MAEEPPSSRRRVLLGAPFALAAARYATVDSFPLSWEGPIRTFDSFVNMTGKTVLITGATTGIGYETAARLAEEGATLVLAGRSQERMQAAARRIFARAKRAGIEQPQVETASLDLASLASVRAFAAAFTRSHAQLDVLLLNAGVSSLPQRTLTEDGLETQFQVRARPARLTVTLAFSIARFHPRSRSHRRPCPQVNYLGHFLLTNQLMPLLRAAPAPRVVSVASVASYLPTARIQLDDLQRAAPLSYGRCPTPPRTLHPAPCTLHPAPCTLHPAPRTSSHPPLQSAPCT